MSTPPDNPPPHALPATPTPGQSLSMGNAPASPYASTLNPTLIDLTRRCPECGDLANQRTRPPLSLGLMLTIVLLAAGVLVLFNIFRPVQNARLMESEPGLGERLPWIPVAELREIAAGTRSRPLTQELLDARGPYGWPLFPDHRLGMVLLAPSTMLQETTLGWPVATIYHTKPLATPRPGLAWTDWSWSRIITVDAQGTVTSIELLVFAPILAVLLLSVILIQHLAHRSRAARTALITLAFLAAALSAFWPHRIVQPEEVSRTTGTGGSMLTYSSLATIPGVPPSTIDLPTLQSLHASPTGNRDLAALLLTTIERATSSRQLITVDSTQQLNEFELMRRRELLRSLGLDPLTPQALDAMNVIFCLDDPASTPSAANTLFGGGRWGGGGGGGGGVRSRGGGGGGGGARFGPAGLPASASSFSTLWNWPVRILGHGTVDVPPAGRNTAAGMSTFFSPQTTRLRWFNPATSTLHVTTLYPRETWPLIGLILLPGVLFAALRRHRWMRRRRAWIAADRCGSCGYSLEGLE